MGFSMQKLTTSNVYVYVDPERPQLVRDKLKSIIITSVQIV